MTCTTLTMDRFISGTVRIRVTMLAAMLLAGAMIAPANAGVVSLQKSEFRMPGDGVRNNNAYIGDFCCTGRTATIRETSGRPVGYIYFFDFRGGLNYGDGTSGMTDAGIHLSGIQNATDPSAARSKGTIWFSADELRRGVKSKSRSIGAFHFEVIVTNARFRDNRILMQSFTAMVKVQVGPAMIVDPRVARELRREQGRRRGNRGGGLGDVRRPLAVQCINPMIESLHAVIVRADQHGYSGTIQLRATLKNAGNADYVSDPTQQAVAFHDGYREFARRGFANLQKGQAMILTAQLQWQTGGEFRQPVKAQITYDPDIRIDANPRNDDCIMGDNVKTISPEVIDRLFAEWRQGH